MVKDFNYFPDRGIYVDEENDHLSAHLFLLGGTKWKSLRQKLTPTFTSGKMCAMFSIVRDCARILADVTPAGSVVEVRELIARYSTDVIASCAFGIDVDSQHNPEAEFRQWRRRFFKPSLRTYLSQALGFSNPKLRTLLPVAFTPKDFTEYFTRVVDETVKHREETGVIRKDFLQLMTQLKNNGYVDDSFSITGQPKTEQKSKTLTTKEVAAQAWMFLIAGFETSSTTVSFCLYELARHPDIQKKVQEEIDDVLKKTNGDVTYEVIMTQMPYLEKVVNGRKTLIFSYKLGKTPKETYATLCNFSMNGIRFAPGYSVEQAMEDLFRSSSDSEGSDAEDDGTETQVDQSEEICLHELEENDILAENDDSGEDESAVLAVYY
ncbi:probable cytochrome P450 6a14 [Schistocerca nitens]|uniref:probable cytochrome P450 6a14 n=1 Tax=Schistocerca nitens TaxID=7011 RepID=UPI002118A499|nr:probable cytochrome P450 6a14 [Schistocerca nitens]